MIGEACDLLRTLLDNYRKKFVAVISWELVHAMYSVMICFFLFCLVSILSGWSFSLSPVGGLHLCLHYKSAQTEVIFSL